MKVHELFNQGKVAWIIVYITLAETTIDPRTSKVADKVGFAMHPGTRQADGSLVRWSNIAGQTVRLHHLER
jgi:multiple sugar transport system substrate-binding protein